MTPNQIDSDPDGPAALPVVSKPVAVLLCLTIFVIGYSFSIWLLSEYTGGDQKFYSNFWYAMMWAHPSQWPRLQLQYLGSAEPLYRLVIGAGTYFEFDRIRYLSFWNGIMLAAIGYILLKYRASILFSILILTNYYLVVLLSSAERLKFAYLVLVLAFCGGGIRTKTTLSFMSVFFHTQAIVQFVSAGLYYLIEIRRSIFSSRWKTVAFFVFIPLLIGIVAYAVLNSAGDVISQKAEFYSGESEGAAEIIQWMLILICGYIVFDKRTQFLIGMLPMGVLTALYGNRINVATLAFFCALSLAQSKTRHPLVLAIMGYMSFKTIGFIMNVISSGDGFLA